LLSGDPSHGFCCALLNGLKVAADALLTGDPSHKLCCTLLNGLKVAADALLSDDPNHKLCCALLNGLKVAADALLSDDNTIRDGQTLRLHAMDKARCSLSLSFPLSLSHTPLSMHHAFCKP
jgi:hypothetical protein